MSYCTIEEAWGSNFGNDVNTRRSNRSSKNKKCNDNSTKNRNIKQELDNFPIFTQKVFSETRDPNSLNSNAFNKNGKKYVKRPITRQEDIVQTEMQRPESEVVYNYESESDGEYNEEEFNYLKTPIMSEKTPYNTLGEEVNRRPTYAVMNEEEQYKPRIKTQEEYTRKQYPVYKNMSELEEDEIMQEGYDRRRRMNEEENTSMDDYNYKLDIFLYIFSGIILIFIMDTFVRIGMSINMKRLRSAPDYILTNK